MTILFGTTTQLTNPALGNLTQLEPVEFTGGLLTTLISVLFVGGAIIFFFMLLTGALLWITSGGDKAKYETAKSKITQAIVGLVILLLVFGIINIVGCLFGINILQFEIGELNVGFANSTLCN